MSLNYYKSLAEDHWKEFLPSLYRDHIENGTLDKALTRAAEQTDREMQAAMDAGTPRDQAWELIRGRYLLLNPETDNDEDYGPNPNQSFLDLIAEIHEATQKIYDDM